MSRRFVAEPTPLPSVWLLHLQPITDERGFLERVFCAEELRDWGHPGAIAQVNRTLTREKAAVRGMHFQYPPSEETKLVSCQRGRVFDVIVDLRPGATFLHWHGIELAEQDHQLLLVPPRCAHGFQALVGGCDMLYLHSAPFAPGAEGGLRAEEPRVGIEWPLPIGIRSARDSSHPFLTDDFAGIVA